MKGIIAAAAGLMLAVHAPAAATTFYATGTFTNGDTLSGTVSIDTVAGAVTAVDLLIGGPGGFEATDLGFYGDDENQEIGGYLFAGLGEQYPVYPFADTFNVIIGLDLVGYAGGVIYSDAVPTSEDYGSSYYTRTTPDEGIDLAEGALFLPEPATWTSLVGGLGLVGVALRRRRTAARCA